MTARPGRRRDLFEKVIAADCTVVRNCGSRLTALVVFGLVTFGFAGCSGGSDTDTQTTITNASSTSTTEALATPTTAQPSTTETSELASTTETSDAGSSSSTTADDHDAGPLMTVDDLDARWGLIARTEAPVDSELPLAEFCEGLSTIVSDLGPVSSAAFDGPDGLAIEWFVVEAPAATPLALAADERFDQWKAEGVHDCVQRGVETLYDSETLEGTIIEAERLPDGTDGFGYRVTVVYLDDDGNQRVLVWSWTMIRAADAIAKIAIVYPDTAPVDVDQILALAADALG
ncbi:MAG: hypothetical protein R2770_16670 [Acidimicrobiales bacterium]